MSSSRSKSDPTLSRHQAEEVLRYWLAALRLEEALQVRPAARPTTGGKVVPQLEEPALGQEYFKVPLGAPLADLLSKQTELKRPFDAELCAFFEAWLYTQYRRGEDDTELSHLLCFPIVHLPNGELAGLLRAGVRLRFGSDKSKAFQAPKRAERQRGAYPLPPTEARLTRTAEPGGGWPFFVDTRLLHRTLGVPTESIDALFEALRAHGSVSEPQMLALLTTLLESTISESQREPESAADHAERLKATAAKESQSTEAWLARLTAAVKLRLEQAAPRARVYPIAIIIDGTRAKTTWHLQREIDSLERDGWTLASPLGAYLTGKPLPSAAAPQRALFPGPALTASQRTAAEFFWGSSLSAVQGPPGTGKTRLILHLCAEAVVRQAEVLSGSRAQVEPLLVTSSNNRAVDNVIEPLGAVTSLPLALRAGSRQACEHKLAPQLRQALAWLKRADGEPAEERSARFTQAKSQFRAQRDAFEQLLAPRRVAEAWAKTRAQLEHELAECGVTSDGRDVSVTAAHARAAILTLRPLEKRLKALSKLCEAEASLASVQAVEAHYLRTDKRQLRALTQALESTKLTLDLALPPRPSNSADPNQRLEAWEDAAELALARLAVLRTELDRAVTAATSAGRARILKAQLAAMDREPPPDPGVSHATDEQARELFSAAVALREAWAGEHARELMPAVMAALRAVEQERSLRAFFRDETPAVRAISHLFGIWGSTLLSLGNCFPSDLGARLVVDEAGQCHPAHAVSGLLRAEAALVIGDVHQLSPVVELGIDDEARLVRRLGAATDYLRPYRIHESSTSSSQSLADRAVSARGQLTDHFRCQPEIIAISDALCGYGLTVHTPRADRSRSAGYLKRPVSLVDLRGQQARSGGSWYNELELHETLALVESLLQSGVQLDEIAVITPYRGQLERLRRGLSERRIPLETSPELAETDRADQRRSGLALGTVHRFQGGERSIVLFSSVVTHFGSLGFLNERPNLLNVAISRAQHHFVCLGHAEVLSRGPRSRLLVDGVATISTAAYAGSLLGRPASFS